MYVLAQLSAKVPVNFPALDTVLYKWKNKYNNSPTHIIKKTIQKQTIHSDKYILIRSVRLIRGPGMSTLEYDHIFFFLYIPPKAPLYNCHNCVNFAMLSCKLPKYLLFTFCSVNVTAFPDNYLGAYATSYGCG